MTSWDIYHLASIFIPLRQKDFIIVWEFSIWRKRDYRKLFGKAGKQQHAEAQIADNGCSISVWVSVWMVLAPNEPLPLYIIGSAQVNECVWMAEWWLEL